MPWNRDDYDALLLGAGLVKAKDLFAYWFAGSEPDARAHAPHRRPRALERGGFSLRRIDLKRWASEVDMLLDLYNRSLGAQLGLRADDGARVPPRREGPEDAGRPAHLPRRREGREGGRVRGSDPRRQRGAGRASTGGSSRSGSSSSSRARRRSGATRILLLGVLPEARGKGIDAALITQVFQRAIEVGYGGGEGSWILEDNVLHAQPTRGDGRQDHEALPPLRDALSEPPRQGVTSSGRADSGADAPRARGPSTSGPTRPSAASSPSWRGRP